MSAHFPYYPNAKKSGSIWYKKAMTLILVVILVLFFLIPIALYKSHYFDVIFFIIQNNEEYSDIEMSLGSIQHNDISYEQRIRLIHNLDKKLSFLLKAYQKNSLLLFYYGKLKYLEHDFFIIRNPNTLVNIYLFHYLGKDYSWPLVNQKIWKDSFFSIRKSMILGLPPNLQEEAWQILAYLCLTSNQVYKQKFIDKQVNYSKIRHPLTTILYQFVKKQTVQWQLIRDLYPDTHISFLTSLDYLNKGYIPSGFSSLKSLLQHKNISPTLKNNAYYIMGYLNHLKNIRKQKWYYSQISFEEFLPRYPQFFHEYTYLLKLLGQTKELKNFLQYYSKLSR